MVAGTALKKSVQAKLNSTRKLILSDSDKISEKIVESSSGGS